MHYCDFCGKQVPIHAQYCRYCGRKLGDWLGDTQPLPVIADTVEDTVNRAPKRYLLFLQSLQKYRPKLYPIFYYLSSLTTVAVLIYVLVTFKTIDDYQILTSALGFLLSVYFWRSARH